MDFGGHDSFVPQYNEPRHQQAANYNNNQQANPVDYTKQAPAEPKPGIGERVRGIFGSMFD
ncbi:cell division protein FtsA C-terminal domain-containing protein [Streptococcus bovimastitidis]|uniref:cell division protein FtsA C-terminal domain-containing protein n=1 Tax=Streptococcus bovimastitidis TaxID=1856638 RepID=UPI003B832743